MGVLLLDMVDNSISPCERISGWFSPHSTVQVGYFILKAYAPIPAFTFAKPPTAIARGVFSLHSRSTCEAWHWWQGIAQDFSR
jgi:hypothetical protein